MTRRAEWLWLGGGAVLVVALLVAASLAFMGRTDPLPHDGSIADPGTPDPIYDHLTVQVHAPGPSITASAARSEKLISMPWVVFAHHDGGRTLEIVAATGDGSCVKPAGYRVEQTDSYVELWLYSMRAPAGTRCLPYVTMWRTDITLARPLGGRTLLHPKTAPDWPASRVFDGYVWATP
ncbi:hypothetical protein GCM10022286_04880 [Gryllotalpicola daejeonensis]|uniref:Uncharacterized protein n=1 Tax=Gryllotalpicola daejeonensis TaxID=993087 RepID=A0ABP7ZEX8_9MICO